MSGRLVIAGPKGAGKTIIANALSSSDDLKTSLVYRPTVGVRILGFEAKKEECVTVYDTSGDPVFFRELISAFCIEPVALVIVWPADQMESVTRSQVEQYTVDSGILANRTMIIFASGSKQEYDSIVPPAFSEIANKSVFCKLEDPNGIRNTITTWLNELDL
jgi:hypothetical protein